MKSLCLHVLDILQNSVKAHTKMVELIIKDSIKDNKYIFTVKDDGIGINNENIQSVTDPFFTTSLDKKIGLGLSLVQMDCRRAGGDLCICSTKGLGSDITFWFNHNSIDRQPLGDIANIVADFAASNKNIRLVYTHITDKGSFVFDSLAAKQALAVSSLNNNKIVQALKQMIDNNLTDIYYNQ